MSDLVSGIAAAAQATNDLGFGIYNAISQYRENKRNRQFAKDMAGYQNSVNHQNWLAENAYNTPAMQLSRMKAAGLNPALAMNNGQSLELAGSNMQAASDVNASPQVAPQLGLSGSNVALSLAQAELARAQADSIRAKTPHEVESIDAGISKLNKETAVLSSTLETMSQDRFLSLLRNSREQQQIENDSARVLNETKMTDAQIERFVHENNLSDAQAEVARSVAALNSRQLYELCQTFALRVAGMDLSNDKLRSEIGLNNKQIEYYDKIIEGLGYDNVTKQFEASEARVLMNGDGELPAGSAWARRIGYLVAQLFQFLRLFSK